MNNNSIRQITDIQSRESKNKPRVPEQDANEAKLSVNMLITTQQAKHLFQKNKIFFQKKVKSRCSFS